MTIYEPGRGSCGHWNLPQEDVVAVSKHMRQCGRVVTIKNANNPHWTTARVVDTCQSCGPEDIAVSLTVFEKIAYREQGTAEVEWTYRRGPNDRVTWVGHCGTNCISGF